MIACPPASHNRKQDEADSEQVEPQDEKQHEGEIFIEISPVDDFHDYARKDEEQTNERRGSEGLKYGLHNNSRRNKQ